MPKKPRDPEMFAAASAMGKKGGKSKSPEKLAALVNSRLLAAAARKAQRSGTHCTRCKKIWAEHDASPCR
jgi:hypothetical protein